MRARLAAIALVAALPAPAAAHELDEYLQAARVSLARDHVLCEIDLTPGANVADALLALVDPDGDGRVSPGEAEAYGRAVLRDVALEVDGRPIPLTLARVEVPAVGAMREGAGTIRVRASGRLPTPAGGRRVVDFRNDHRPREGVYLVNALAPDDRDITIAAQARDPLQRGIRLEYDIGPARPVQALWLLTGGIGIAGLIAGRRRPSPRQR
jgi:hypothetical protein